MRYILFGIGNEVRLKYSNEFVETIQFIVDNDENKWGKRYCGKVIQEPTRELLNKDSFIIVSSIWGYDEIKEQLNSYGLKENENYIWGPNWYGNEEIPSTYGFKYWQEYDNVIDFSTGKWDYRVQKVASLIPKDADTIMDLGAGAMTLKKYIDEKTSYIPVDYCKRCAETLVCNLDNNEFPDVNVDCIVASGIIEYISDVKWFVKMICNSCNSAVISYIPIEKMGDFSIRQHEGWRNNLTIIELSSLFIENGFVPKIEKQCIGNDLIIRFEKNK